MNVEITAQVALLFAGVCGLLIFATVVGEYLRMRQPAGTSDPAVETYVTRVHGWWAMVILVSFALMLGRTAVILLFAFASFAALREFLTQTAKHRADHWALIAAFYVIFPLQYFALWWGNAVVPSILVPVFAFLGLPMLSVLRGAGKRFLRRVAETQWALMICVYCVSQVPALMLLDTGDGRSLLLIAWLVLVVQLGDLAEYYAGRKIGRRRLAESVSPKTMEGALIGTAIAMLTGGLLSWITPYGVIAATGLAGFIFLIGLGGSLVLAAIKADLGVRNWGHLIPGQGGFVDQMDSVVFAAPVLFHLTRYFWGVA